MISEQEADVCIVGMGAAGGIAAYVLAAQGLEVVGLEAGPGWTNSDFPWDELTAFNFRNTLGKIFNNSAPTWRRREGAPTGPATFSLGRMMNGVGGGDIHFGAWSRRFLPGDFTALSDTLRRYGAEVLPPGSALADWPLTYDDLEPYYDHVEYALGVSGIARNVRGQEPPASADGNPFEGMRSRPYPLPPLRPYPLGERFREVARQRGYHPYTVPAAIITEDYDGRPACTYCGWCSGYGCYNGAKSSTLVSVIPKALKTGNLDLRTNCRAVRVESQGDKARGVTYLDEGGQVHFQPARIVVLAAYTWENVRLLLLSTSRCFPDGLSNNHGQVGKYFMTRQFPEVAGLFPDFPMDKFMGPVAQAVAIDDFNGDNFDHTGLGFLRGGTIGTENQIQPILASSQLPPDVPAWGRRYRDFITAYWNHITYLRAQPEPLAYEMNFLDLDPVVKDDLGQPVIRITYDLYPNELRLIDFLQDRMEELMRDMGAVRTWRGPRETGVASCHDLGGTRMGKDSKDSVVDRYQRSHEVPNLYILGGCTFPTATGTNPTETIQALAWMSAEHIAHELR